MIAQQSSQEQKGPIYLGGAAPTAKNRWDRAKDWFRKNQRSVFVGLIVILVVAGGIYYFEKSLPTDQEKKQAQEQITTDKQKQAEQAQNEQKKEEKKAPQEERILTKDAVIEKAIKGDGITHLGRKALAAYLEENPQVKDGLSKEHKIYIEDYLKDAKVQERSGKKTLQIGEEVSFSKDLIKQAIDSSKKLSDNQLKQIQQKYSPLVPDL